MSFFRKVFGIGLPFTPWRHRELKWDENTYNNLIKDVQDILPTERSPVKRFKVVIIGPRGHGKSSLINSFAAISAETKTGVCFAADEEENVTTIFRYFDFPGQLEHFSVGDVQGLSKATNEKMEPYLNTLKRLIKGHIKEGYEFKTTETISEGNEFYISNPSPEDKIHCVIIVYDCEQAALIHYSDQNSLRTIIKSLQKWNVPVVAILTKADKRSIHVNYDIQSIFRCNENKAAVDATSESLNIPKSYVYPVVNFQEKDVYRWKDSIPLLLALKSCLNLAKGHLHNARESKTNQCDV